MTSYNGQAIAYCWVLSSIMRKGISAGKIDLAQGRDLPLIADKRDAGSASRAAKPQGLLLTWGSAFCYQAGCSSRASRCFIFKYFPLPHRYLIQDQKVIPMSYTFLAQSAVDWALSKVGCAYS